jgi:peptide subunit release factor 1 (eRF1)
MHQSNHTYSEQKRKAEEDSIKIDIDEEIEEDFEQDFNQNNRKSMKNIESRVELISSSLNQNNQLKSALDGVRKFVQQ